MSIEIVERSPAVCVVTVKGQYTYADAKELESHGRKWIDADEKVRLLFLADKFTGWGKDGDWGDLTFMHQFDPHLEKLAIVSDDKWRDEMLMFAGAGRRMAQVEFFATDEIQQANQWLAED